MKLSPMEGLPCMHTFGLGGNCSTVVGHGEFAGSGQTQSQPAGEGAIEYVSAAVSIVCMVREVR